MTPQLIYIILIAMGVGVSIADHGKPKKGNENAWPTILSAIISLTLLYIGGFFNNF